MQLYINNGKSYMEDLRRNWVFHVQYFTAWGVNLYDYLIFACYVFSDYVDCL